MKRTSVVVGMIVAVAILGVGNSTAQEWSPEQQKIWSVVEGYWAAMAARDTIAIMDSYDVDYCGWNSSDPLPVKKETAVKWIRYGLAQYEYVIHDIQPVGIIVLDDVAIVHYYYTARLKKSDGEIVNSSGRFTDILRETDGMWRVIADHGGDDD